MTHRWPARALIVLASLALLLPAAPAADAATKPVVPTLDAVATIYPHLEGGTADITRERRIRMPSKTCKRGALLKGASGVAASYAPKFETTDDLAVTGAEPVVTVTAATFASARTASHVLRAIVTEGEDCPSADNGNPRIERIKFGLGDERWGARATMGDRRFKIRMNVLFFRDGTRVLSVVSMATDGPTAPSVPKTIALARLALETVG